MTPCTLADGVEKFSLFWVVALTDETFVSDATRELLENDVRLYLYALICTQTSLLYPPIVTY